HGYRGAQRLRAVRSERAARDAQSRSHNDHSGDNGGLMRVLMIASEAVPFAKTGGLADVMGALPHALGHIGHTVDVVIPRYHGIMAGTSNGNVTVRLGGQVADAGISIVENGPVRTVFVDYPAYFDREFLYGTTGHDYPDNPERFAFLAL